MTAESQAAISSASAAVSVPFVTAGDGGDGVGGKLHTANSRPMPSPLRATTCIVL